MDDGLDWGSPGGSKTQENCAAISDVKFKFGEFWVTKLISFPARLCGALHVTRYNSPKTVV